MRVVMKKKCFVERMFPILFIIVFGGLLYSCNSGYKTNWKDERDSILKVNLEQRQVLDDMTSTVVQIAAGLDSITRQEQILTSRFDAEGRALSRKKMIENLKIFEDILHKKRLEIKRLDSLLTHKNSDMQKLYSLVAYLNEVIDKKDETIQMLRSELHIKNASIRKLSGQLSSLNSNLEELSDSISGLKEESDLQKQRIDDQEKVFNIVYYVIGSKKDLSKKGILKSKGLLGKTSINYSALDKSVFKQDDLRKLKNIDILGSSPKVLSNMPANSYSIISKDKNNSTLHILDAEKFWSVSKYLVIQVKL